MNKSFSSPNQGAVCDYDDVIYYIEAKDVNTLWFHSVPKLTKDGDIAREEQKNMFTSRFHHHYHNFSQKQTTLKPTPGEMEKSSSTRSLGLPVSPHVSGSGFPPKKKKEDPNKKKLASSSKNHGATGKGREELLRSIRSSSSSKATKFYGTSRYGKVMGFDEPDGLMKKHHKVVGKSFPKFGFTRRK